MNQLPTILLSVVSLNLMHRFNFCTGISFHTLNVEHSMFHFPSFQSVLSSIHILPRPFLGSPCYSSRSKSKVVLARLVAIHSSQCKGLKKTSLRLYVFLLYSLYCIFLLQCDLTSVWTHHVFTTQSCRWRIFISSAWVWLRFSAIVEYPFLGARCTRLRQVSRILHCSNIPRLTGL